MEEELRNTVEATDQNAQYDACAKRILGNKQILAHIIKAAIPGFQDMKPSEIIPYIEGEPLIGNVRIEPELTNPSMSEVISGMNTEDTDRSEGKIYFDVLFYLLEETGLSKVIINVEAQRKEDAGYPIINRGIYYGAGMSLPKKEGSLSIPTMETSRRYTVSGYVLIWTRTA